MELIVNAFKALVIRAWEACSKKFVLNASTALGA
jgi:hypothetical protein